jgi:hypothetical protein
MTQPLIKIVIYRDGSEQIQIRPIETIDFKKRLKTFKYLNKNRRWVQGTVEIDAEIVFYMESVAPLMDK